MAGLVGGSGEVEREEEDEASESEGAGMMMEAAAAEKTLWEKETKIMKVRSWYLELENIWEGRTGPRLVKEKEGKEERSA